MMIFNLKENDENESRSLNKSSSTPGGPAAVSRTITLQMLLEAGILQPGNGTMSIEYLVSRNSQFKIVLYAIMMILDSLYDL